MKELIFSILLLFFVNTSSQTQVIGQKDSIDIRALLQNQIAQIKSKDEQKNDKKEIIRAEPLSSKAVESNTTHPENNTIESASSSSESIFIKLFLLTDLGLGLILFVLWRRRNLKIKSVEKSWLKKNIVRLRQDKITARENQELRKLRKQLRLEPVCNSNSPEYLSKFAKQQSISKGELLLAARLNAYKRVKDVNSGF